MVTAKQMTPFGETYIHSRDKGVVRDVIPSPPIGNPQASVSSSQRLPRPVKRIGEGLVATAVVASRVLEPIARSDWPRLLVRRSPSLLFSHSFLPCSPRGPASQSNGEVGKPHADVEVQKTLLAFVISHKHSPLNQPSWADALVVERQGKTRSPTSSGCSSTNLYTFCTVVHPTGTGRPSGPGGMRCVRGACRPNTEDGNIISYI